MTPKVLYCFPQSAGKSFTPSNGTEGMIFCGAFCDRCIHEKFTHTQNHADKQCEILNASLLYDFGTDKYPKEWVYNEEGWPVCTAWVKWDWNKGDDGNWNDPPEPQPDDPMQLCLPFATEEIEKHFTKPIRIRVTA